ncbi:TPA: hypothetical protein SMI57_001371 [Serratia liquefaciens]|nr:hypothetical protein [Serratia liquefaciens]
MTILEDDKFPNGMLIDTNIIKALDLLFSENHDPSKAKYSTYEISIDGGFEIIKYDDAGDIQRCERLNEDGLVSAAPGDTILVYSKEKFKLPENVYARVNTVGQIFMAGFSAENTYIDPGFSGKISITLINNSNRTLTMQAGAPLARVEFIKLESVPENIHPGRNGVRASKVKPSIDSGLTESFENLELHELIKQIKSSITIDAIQKKSVRTDIALTRAYLNLVQNIEDIKSSVDVQNRKLKWSRRLAGFAMGTATALWMDKFGFPEWFLGLFGEGSGPTYWLNIIINVLCSVVATPLYAIIIGSFQNEKTKKKSVS